MVSLDAIQVDKHMNYVENPVAILDRKLKVMCSKEVSLVNVRWQHQRGSEWTWQPEAEMREHYPDLCSAGDFEDEVYFKWGRFVTPRLSSIFKFIPWF